MSNTFITPLMAELIKNAGTSEGASKGWITRHANGNALYAGKTKEELAAGTTPQDYIGYHTLRANEEEAKGNLPAAEAHYTIVAHHVGKGSGGVTAETDAAKRAAWWRNQPGARKAKQIAAHPLNAKALAARAAGHVNLANHYDKEIMDTFGIGSSEALAPTYAAIDERMRKA